MSHFLVVLLWKAHILSLIRTLRSIKVRYEDIEIHTTLSFLSLLPSDRSTTSLCTKTRSKVEQRSLWPDLILRPAGVSGDFELPWWLLSWFQVRLLRSVSRGPRRNHGKRKHGVLPVAGICRGALVCRAAELWSARGTENKGRTEPARLVLCAGGLPRAFVDRSENWCQMRVTSRRLHEICIEMYSSLSRAVFEILCSGDWWIDLDSLTGTNWTCPPLHRVSRPAPNRPQISQMLQIEKPDCYLFFPVVSSDRSSFICGPSPRGGTGTVFQFCRRCFANSGSSPGDASGATEST